MSTASVHPSGPDRHNDPFDPPFKARMARHLADQLAHAQRTFFQDERDEAACIYTRRLTELWDVARAFEITNHVWAIRVGGGGKS